MLHVRENLVNVVVLVPEEEDEIVQIMDVEGALDIDSIQGICVTSAVVIRTFS